MKPHLRITIETLLARGESQHEMRTGIHPVLAGPCRLGTLLLYRETACRRHEGLRIGTVTELRDYERAIAEQ